MTARPDLAGLVGARICHDLIGPIGAIGNGLELLGLDGGPPSPEMTLMNDSVAGATAKLKFLRIALGHAGEGQSLGDAEILALLEGAAPSHRFSYSVEVPGPCPRPDIRCVFLGVLCLQSAMPAGGAIEVAASGGVWTLFGRAETLRMQSELWSGLTGAETDLPFAAGDVQFALLPDAVRSLGRQVQAAQRRDGILISF